MSCKIGYVVLLSMLVVACKQQSALNSVPSVDNKMVAAHRPTVIYKTKGDYYYNVPITLTADKEKIVSYPAPTDTKVDGELALPTKLAKEYLLDNRGIGVNSAFTKYTYSEYSALTNLPSLDDFKRSVIDNNPFSEIWISKESLSVEEINKLIEDELLNQCFERVK